MLEVRVASDTTSSVHRLTTARYTYTHALQRVLWVYEPCVINTLTMCGNCISDSTAGGGAARQRYRTPAKSAAPEWMMTALQSHLQVSHTNFRHCAPTLTCVWHPPTHHHTFGAASPRGARTRPPRVQTRGREPACLPQRCPAALGPSQAAARSAAQEVRVHAFIIAQCCRFPPPLTLRRSTNYQMVLPPPWLQCCC